MNKIMCNATHLHEILILWVVYIHNYVLEINQIHT